ncbi:threonine/serine dehydratase [Arenibaculum sp.]|jgi:threonine dehydratase|uniref:threonine/serine dehydratase n=1 Tax=Arenibaculum sp. TaxID=2865862 RepID=UPI002E129E48|nr:threonine/serine dehydratase [Arenibaculum sp.]
MSTVPSADLPVFTDVLDAAARLRGKAVQTPLLESPLLNDRLGGRLLVKPEMLQRTGSFKFRGAFNRVSLIPEEERRRGVVAFSSGNHAQGVAAAARLLGVPATIVMPSDAPPVKTANTRAWGARVVQYDRWTEDREAIAASLAASSGATLVRPYDDRYVIAGQGTIGIEIADQAAVLGIEADDVLVPAGGGGLVAGVSLALAERLPGLRVHSAEPEGFDDHRRSLEAGARVGNDPAATSFCDALLAPTPGRITFAVNRALLAGGVAVGDDEVCTAMAAAFEYFKLVVEPGGAVALAAVLAGRIPVEGRTVVVVCSGGNVEPALHCEALRRAAAITAG